MGPTLNPEKIRILQSRLQDSREVCIVTHFHPDGDAIGSSLALQHFINCRLSPKASTVLSSPLPENLCFLPGCPLPDAESDPAVCLRAIASADLIVCLDCSGLSRTESLRQEINRSNAFKILIDHHLSPSEEEFDLVFSSTVVSSTCELLYRILLALPQSGGRPSGLPSECVTALMTGMTTDTNNFANSVFPGTLEMASGLLEAGVDREIILDHIYRSNRERRLRLLGYLLSEGMRITPSGVAYMIIDSALAARFGIRDGETDGFVNEPLGIGEVKMSLLLKEDKGWFRVSIRSKRGISANGLAATFFHGGGHEQAAGGRLYWPQDIPAKENAAEYIEEVTARFMQNDSAPTEQE